MNYKQLVVPNLGVNVAVGNCLMYVREAFGAPAGTEYAWEGWENATLKHTGSDFPADVSVPIWFSYIIGGADEGHVAINVPGVGIYSSPWQGGLGHYVARSVAELICIYSDDGEHPMALVGWSEDVNGLRVVEAVTPSVTTTSPVPDTGLVDHKGTATVTVASLNVRSEPSTTASIVATYVSGQTFNYDSYIITSGYVWLSYISTSGVRHYVAEGVNNGIESDVWVSGGV
jgi:hypothetical protein